MQHALENDDRGDDQQDTDRGPGENDDADLLHVDLFPNAQDHGHQQQRQAQGAWTCVGLGVQRFFKILKENGISV